MSGAPVVGPPLGGCWVFLDASELAWLNDAVMALLDCEYIEGARLEVLAVRVKVKLAADHVWKRGAVANDAEGSP